MKRLPWGAWKNRLHQSAMVYGLIGTALRVGVNLMVLPLILKFLTPADQALWWVFVSLGGFANLVDFGFGNVISRVYSYLWAGAEDFEATGLRAAPVAREPNIARIRDLNVAASYLYFRLSVGACGILAVAGTLFLLKPLQGQPHVAFYWMLWAVHLCAVGYTLATCHWMLASQGINRVREINAAVAVGTLAYAVSLSLMLWAGFGLASMVLATALRAFLVRNIARRAYLKAIPPAAQRPSLDRQLLKKLWPNSWKFGLQSVCAYTLFNISVLVSSHMLTKQLTASVGLTNQVVGFATNISLLWLAVKWPQLTIFRTQARLEDMSVLFARRLAMACGSYVFLAILVLFLANPLLAWKHTTTRLLPTPYLLVVLTAAGWSAFYQQWGMLAMTNNTVPFYKNALITAFAIAGLTIGLTYQFGLWGLVVGPPIAEITVASWYLISWGYRGQPLNWMRLLKAAITGR